MTESPNKPEENPLEQLVSRLDKQVRKEADLRIIALTLEYRKMASQLLNDEEMEICAGYFGILLEDPETELPADAMSVFQKLDADPAIRAVFERLFTLVQAKIRTRELEFSPRQILSPIMRGSGYEDFPLTGKPGSRLSKSG